MIQRGTPLVKTVDFSCETIHARRNLHFYFKCKFILRYNLHTKKFTLSKCTAQWILICSQGCATTIHYLILEDFNPIKRNLVLISSHSLLLPPLTSWQSLIYFSSLNLLILDNPYKQNTIICSPLYLDLFTYLNCSRFVRN